MARPLARVVDPEELAGSTGPRARLRIAVPAEWLESGALELRVAAPRLLPCDRCDGGGCDGCARSGALRAPEDAAARVIAVSLGQSARDGAKLRIATPFDDCDIAQLILEIGAGELSEGVERVVPVALAKRPRKRAVSTRALLVVAALALGVTGIARAKACGLRCTGPKAGATHPASPR